MTLHTVDYTSESNIQSVLEGVDVVISALSGGGIAVQPSIAKAAKKAGVKLFVPSEWGHDTTIIKEGLLAFKYQFHQVLKDLELPFVSVANGHFTDQLFYRTFVSSFYSYYIKLMWPLKPGSDLIGPTERWISLGKETRR